MLVTQSNHSIQMIYPLQLVTSGEELKRISRFRKSQYKALYPNIDGYTNDPFDKHAFIYYSQNNENNVTSTARLVLDGIDGLPEDNIFQNSANKFRQRGYKLMELGRFVITNDAPKLLKHYYRAFYLTAKQHNIDAILMVMREKDIAFHENMIGAKTLPETIEQGFGSQHKFVTVIWEIKQTKSRFFSWAFRYRS